MALYKKTSEFIKVWVRTAENGNKVVVLESRFVPFELEVDDEDKAEQIILLLRQAMERDAKPKKRVDLPEFYQGR